MPSMFSDQTVVELPLRLTFLHRFTLRDRLLPFALVAMLLLLAPPQARAQMSIDTKTSQELQIKTSTAELNVEIRVHNGDDADRQIAVGERLYKSGEQTSIALTSAGRPDHRPSAAEGRRRALRAHRDARRARRLCRGRRRAQRRRQADPALDQAERHPRGPAGTGRPLG